MTTQWSRIARRVRVPAGFAFAVFFLLLARPTVRFLAFSLVLVLPGLLLRAYASGYVQKNEELTMSGPYAYTRNPLYLGSMMIAFGFALGARSLWIAAAMAVLFGAIYIPVIRSEEDYLRGRFAGFAEYADRVPRLVPWKLPARGAASAGGRFSGALYQKHREYHALLGAVAMYAALILKLIWILKEKGAA
ncbi:MAG: isoprenylcysteine carboxylmethyltransferase family protein [Acidobacteriaceae bacterium]